MLFSVAAHLPGSGEEQGDLSMIFAVRAKGIVELLVPLHCWSLQVFSSSSGSAGRGKEGLKTEFNLRQALQGRLLHIKVYFPEKNKKKDL